MELPCGLLIPRLSTGGQTAPGQQHEQIPGIETKLHRFIADEHMAQILRSAAHLILA